MFAGSKEWLKLLIIKSVADLFSVIHLPFQLWTSKTPNNK